MTAVATAGAAAWVVPEILTAKPAAGAALSSTTGGVTTSPASTSALAFTSATTPDGSLAFTGVDIQRDAEIGAALIAGGWAMHHWASRTPKAAEGARWPGRGVQSVRPDQARSTDTPT